MEWVESAGNWSIVKHWFWSPPIGKEGLGGAQRGKNGNPQTLPTRLREEPNLLPVKHTR